MWDYLATLIGIYILEFLGIQSHPRKQELNRSHCKWNTQALFVAKLKDLWTHCCLTLASMWTSLHLLNLSWILAWVFLYLQSNLWWLRGVDSFNCIVWTLGIWCPFLIYLVYQILGRVILEATWACCSLRITLVWILCWWAWAQMRPELPALWARVPTLRFWAWSQAWLQA